MTGAREIPNNGRQIHCSTEIHHGFHVHLYQYQPTDRPIEDRFSSTVDNAVKRLIVGIYDGHGGAATADHISTALPSALISIDQRPPPYTQTFETLDGQMLARFTNDHSILRVRSPNWVQNARVIKSGCTALILDLEADTGMLTFANAGDSRAVICDASGNIMNQTTDLNAKNPSERQRLRLEHPNEPNIIVSDRLFGKLMTTRGFGDGYYKLPNGLMGKKHRKFIDILSSLEQRDKVPMNAQYTTYFHSYKTPPYITAKPEVGSIQLKQGDLVIAGTDGLWDIISNETASGVVSEGVSIAAPNLAQHLFQKAVEKQKPGDDVTVVIIHVLKRSAVSDPS
ncbi:phosphatase 2C-like domain-containing protein [Infundibulicybe gibba]|nr:phosphatase 2C-like domain-containing protein [Infundibulicybe gibba]